ncbi:MAG TPA: hypothetical protein VKU61_07355 [Candidatus Binatia bacterium]|nr:hypothetical protein [Candidatus Binatia bacterium]
MPEIAQVIWLLAGERPSRRLIDALVHRTEGDPRKLLIHLLVAFTDETDLPAALEQLTNETLRQLTPRHPPPKPER